MVITFAIVYVWFTEFMVLVSGVLFALVLTGTLLLTDDKFIGANTYEEIVERRNIAYALYLLAIAITYSVGFLGAVLVFFTLR